MLFLNASLRRYGPSLVMAAGLMLGMFSGETRAWQVIATSPRSSSAEDEAFNQIPVLDLTPAAEPIPAMQYRLWPDKQRLQTGNALVRFQRAGLLRLEYAQQNPEASRMFWDNWNRWIEMPIEALPIEDVRQSLERYRLVMRELHSGRALVDSQYDLPVENIKGVETIEILLPEFQAMRSLARLLQLEIRLAIAEGRIDDAILYSQTGFRLGEATGQAIDFLVARLVGLAISNAMLGEVENLIQAEECPNLYWALASLPPSVSEVLESVQFEASIMTRLFDLQDLPGPGQPAEFWEARVVELASSLRKVQFYGMEKQADLEVKSRLMAGFAIIGLAEYSKRVLIENGFDADVVEAMSPAEAVVRSTARSAQIIQDDFVKWTHLPTGLRKKYVEAQEEILQRMQSETQGIGDLGAVMANLLLPTIQATDAASLRSQQAIARLITIEAIRHYVSTTGNVPNQLLDLEQLPAWKDPFTGNHFGYEKMGPKTAKLSRAPRWASDTDTTVILSFE